MTLRNENAMAEYHFSHEKCGVCWWPRRDSRRRLELHHLAGRKHPQSNTPANFILLCSPGCHTQLHVGGFTDERGRWPLLTPGHIPTAKADEDGFCDVQWLAFLRNKKHLGYEAAPIPEFYITERRAR